MGFRVQGLRGSVKLGLMVQGFGQGDPAITSPTRWSLLSFGSANMGGCQNYGPFLGTLKIRCRIIMGIQKRIIILTTTHMKQPKSSCDTCWNFF